MVGENPLACVAPLFVTADRPDRFAKAAASGADAVFIDLEDAVAPASKVRAREGPGGFRSYAVPTFLRVKAPAMPWHADDIALAGTLPLAGIIVPKVQSANVILALRRALGVQKAIVALIETAEGLARAREVAAANRNTRLAFGSIDFSVDIGCDHTREALLYARSEIVMASRLGMILPPLDGVTAEIRDPDLADSDARYAAGLGFTGKLCIHPSQIPPVQAGYAPSESELAWARDVLSTEDAGSVSLNGQMIDAPVRQRAEALLARNRTRMPRS